MFSLVNKTLQPKEKHEIFTYESVSILLHMSCNSKFNYWNGGMHMDLENKIFVAGHNGLVGSSLVRQLTAKGYRNLICKTREDLDLLDQDAVSRFFQEERPEYVLLAAAKVGGILANSTYPAEFIHDNLVLQTNVIHNAYLSGVKRLLFLGSSCIYPKFAPQPMSEDCLLKGELEPTNEPYAISKIAGMKMCEAYNRQYGTRFLSVMPTNLYGPNDNFDNTTSHVLPALLRRFHEAKTNNQPTVTIWGTGTPSREFLHVDDMAAACIHVMNLPEAEVEKGFLSVGEPAFVNIGCGSDVTIGELAMMIKDVVGYEGTIDFDTTKPDGTPRKLLNVSKLNALGWHPQVALREGLKSTYSWFMENYIN